MLNPGLLVPMHTPGPDAAAWLLPSPRVWGAGALETVLWKHSAWPGTWGICT